jgi:farnesyl-diphosphate farnesyltransferase
MLPPRLNELLRQTSRSFYLTLRVLPLRIRKQISLAYLLARTSDTIADTEIVSPEQRLTALQQLRARLAGAGQTPLDFGLVSRQVGGAAERELLERVEETLAALAELSAADLRLVRQVLGTIVSGQELDLRRFQSATERNIVALANEAELDDYTYRVAGCVGEFWTRLCQAHGLGHGVSLHDPEVTEAACVDWGIRFGKGLQLVNILRDVPADLRQGRCYLPADELAAAGLAPGDLLSPAQEKRFRPVYDQYLTRAEAYLRVGWRYTNAIPWRHIGLRLAGAWPILIGFETMAALRQPGVLDPARRIKITRVQVRSIVWRSIVYYAMPGRWRQLVPAGGAGCVTASGKAVA